MRPKSAGTQFRKFVPSLAVQIHDIRYQMETGLWKAHRCGKCQPKTLSSCKHYASVPSTTIISFRGEIGSQARRVRDVDG